MGLTGLGERVMAMDAESNAGRQVREALPPGRDASSNVKACHSGWSSHSWGTATSLTFSGNSGPGVESRFSALDG